jgi:hypothetical protein
MRRRQMLISAAVAGAVVSEALPQPVPGKPTDRTPEAQRERLVWADHTIEVSLEAGFPLATQHAALAWVRQSANAVSAYFQKFPLDSLDLRLARLPGSGVRGGLTSVDPAPFVRVGVGADTSPTQFLADWVLVHEMVHLAVPRLARQHNWLHEGLATYVEGVARTRAGIMTAPVFWGELATGLPQGLPKDGDQGLDHTRTWGRTYWGGALFCLLADVRMRTESHNRMGLQNALQGLLARGSSYAVQWPIEQVLRTADLAVGQSTLMDLYTQMKDSPVAVNLPALWQSLGVQPTGRHPSHLNNDAPLAAVRRAIA